MRKILYSLALPIVFLSFFASAESVTVYDYETGTYQDYRALPNGSVEVYDYWDGTYRTFEVD